LMTHIHGSVFRTVRNNTLGPTDLPFEKADVFQKFVNVLITE